MQSWQETSRQPASLGTETLCPQSLTGKQRPGCRRPTLFRPAVSRCSLRAFAPSSGGETSSRSAFCGHGRLSAAESEASIVYKCESLIQLQRDLSCVVGVRRGRRGITRDERIQCNFFYRKKKKAKLVEVYNSEQVLRSTVSNNSGKLPYFMLPSCLSCYAFSQVCACQVMEVADINSWKDLSFVQDQIDICGGALELLSLDVPVKCVSRSACRVAHDSPVLFSLLPLFPVCRRSATSAPTQTPLCSTPPS